MVAAPILGLRSPAQHAVDGVTFQETERGRRIYHRGHDGPAGRR